MRVCLVSYEYPPQVGGEASYTEGLAEYLSRLGAEVVVLTSDQGGNVSDASSGPEIIRLGVSRRRPLRIGSFQAATSLFLSKNREDFDVVHQTNDYFFPLPSGRGVDIVTMHHPLGEEERVVRTLLGEREAAAYLRQRDMRYLKAMQKEACRRAPRIISVSRFTAQSLARDYIVPPDTFDICPNGIVVKEFDSVKGKEESRISLDIEPSAPVLIHVGRLDYNKDLSTLLSAFMTILEELPDCRLVVIGSGPQSGWLHEYVPERNLADRVYLLGRVSRGTLLEAYAAADVVILSSLMEGFGITLAEAMAAGRPCVATRCGGTEEVILPERTGLLVPPGGPSYLAGAASRILSRPSLARRLGKAGRRRAESLFDWPVVIRRMSRLYEASVESK
jgi:glycosyltransferase involved in cell wall biosynthesis